MAAVGSRRTRHKRGAPTAQRSTINDAAFAELAAQADALPGADRAVAATSDASIKVTPASGQPNDEGQPTIDLRDDERPVPPTPLQMLHRRLQRSGGHEAGIAMAARLFLNESGGDTDSLYKALIGPWAPTLASTTSDLLRIDEAIRSDPQYGRAVAGFEAAKNQYLKAQQDAVKKEEKIQRARAKEQRASERGSRTSPARRAREIVGRVLPRGLSAQRGSGGA